MNRFKFLAAAIALFSATFLHVPPSQAAGAAQRKHLASFVRVLSFDEITRLSPAKRSAYLAGLRAMMVEIDRLPKNLHSSSDVRLRTSQIASLLSMFAVSDAWAETGIPYVGANGSVTCGAGYNARVPTPPMIGVNGHSNDPRSYVCVSGKRRSDKKCGSGLIPVRQDQDGTFECATVQSFNHLPSALQANARRERHFDSLFDHSGKLFTDGYPSEESLRTKLVRPPQPVVAVAKSIAVKKPAPAPKPVAEVLAARIAAEKTVAQRNPEAAKLLPPAEAAPNVLPPPVASREIVQDAAVVHSPEAEKPAKAITVVPLHQNRPREDVGDDLKTCAPDESKTCDATAVEKARLQYASDADPDCIYAGGISTYQDGKKRAYGCMAPSKFCFGSKSCSSSTGENMKADYSCEANQVICNPLVFGVHADGKSPFCIEKSANATAACDDESNSDEKAITPLEQEHAGLKEAWNDFADRLFTLCNKNKIAAQLHCAECDIISKRLFVLNVASRDVKSCGAAIKYDEANCDDDGTCHGRPGAPSAPKTAAGGASRGVSSVGEPATPSSPKSPAP